MTTPTAQDYLHVVLGDSAGDTLREAIATRGLPGTVLVVPDDLSNGPLHDGRARSAYWRMLSGRNDVPDDVFGARDDLHKRIAANEHLTVVTWVTDAVSDSVLHRLVLWWLRDVPDNVACINVTRLSGRCGLGRHSAEEMKRAFDQHLHVLHLNERVALVQEFEAMKNGTLRVHQAGRIATVAPDHFDGRLMAFVDKDWRPAGDAIAKTMAAADAHDCIGDSFFAWRIRELVKQGEFEAQGDETRLAQYQIRRRV